MFDKQSTVEKSASDTFTRLLSATRLIKPTDLEEAQKSAKRLDVSISRALIMLKLSSENTLRAPLQAEELVRKGKLSFEMAVKAILLTKQNGIELEDAINVLGAVVNKTQTVPSLVSPLTELMIESDLLTTEQLGQTMVTASDNKMSLGQTMVVLRFVSRWAVNECLHAQLLVKEHKINKEQAINALRASARRRVSIYQVLFEGGQYNESSGETIRLGELLLLSGVISESDYLDTLEAECAANKPFGQMLMERKFVDSNVFEAACQILDMIGSVLQPFQAAETLRQVKLQNIPVYQAIAQLQPPPQVSQRKLRLGDLVVESGISTRDQIESIAQPADDSPIRIGKKLLAAGILTEPILYNTLRCQSLAKEGLLSADNAVTVLKTTRNDGLTIEEALQKLNWYPPARMHWSWV